MSILLDLIFPKFCLGCAVEGTYLCPGCQQKIIAIKYQTCPACMIITKRGWWCPKHRDTDTPGVSTGDTSGKQTDLTKRLIQELTQKTGRQQKQRHFLSGIMAFGYYYDPIVREAIHLLKYRRIDELAQTLADLAAGRLKALIPHSKVILIPVPLHPWRQRYRDFNQAELLVEELAGHWQLAHLDNQLVRTKHRPAQVELPFQKRLTNVQGGFAWQGDARPIKNKTVWLVDDVATTGATLEACAQVLKHNGARSVWGVVLAKG